MEEELPQIIYKYARIDQYLYESLLNGQLWFNTPADFNDPFDSNIPWSDYYSHKASVELRKWGPERGVNDRVYFDFFDAFNQCRNSKSVCCFSSVRDNLLLWSHYADKHKGVLLAFDVKELKKVFTTIKKVNYDNDLLDIDINHDPQLIFEKYLFKKSVDWEIEEEIRILNEKSGCYKFPKEALVEICFGMRCANISRSIVIQLTQNNAYENISYSEVIPERNKYALRTLPIIIVSKPTRPYNFFD